MSYRTRNNHSPHFRTIKAVFEPTTANMTLSPHSSHSAAPTPLDEESPSLTSSLIAQESSQDYQETIDTVVLESSAELPAPVGLGLTHHPHRPAPSLRPSWIGRPASRNSNAAGNMSQKVTITYSSPGLHPPVYVTTSLSEPPWEVLEMEISDLQGGEHGYAKTFLAEEGEYQYKFRFGPGDWWVCDEGKPMVDDGFGNRNNLLVVEKAAPVRAAANAEPPASVPAGEPDQAQGLSQAHQTPAIHVEEKHEDRAPLFAHEHDASHKTLDIPDEDVPYNFSPQDTQPPSRDEGFNGAALHSTTSPLMSHESIAPPVQSHPAAEDDDDLDRNDEPDLVPTSPVIQHETAQLSTREHEHAPLFSHEASPEDHREGRTVPSVSGSPFSSRHASQNRRRESHIPPEADPNDPSLEHFPTTREEIMNSLRRASEHMPEDETTHEGLIGSPSSSAVHSSFSRSPSLPSVHEEDEAIEHQKLETVAEDKAAEHPNKSTMQHLADGLSMLSAATERPAALITPPRTPEETAQPQAREAHHSDHHHQSIAQRDMQEEAMHEQDVKHPDHGRHHQQTTQGSAAHMDGESSNQPDTTTRQEPDESMQDKPEGSANDQEEDTESESKEEKEKEQVTDGKPELRAPPKSFFGSFFEAALGLGLTIIIGAAAAWLAFRMQDAVKDGGAALSGV